ncbi:MAG: hypothetical protein IJS73_06570 [Paludibacteraceae bacterium]|nr:hypothetical protein [Paludibacteraceae bacterium]
MSTAELNVELFRQLSYIADDETMMQKVIKYMKGLTVKKKTKDETDYLMSSPAMRQILKQGQEDIQAGKGEVININDLWK